jgi:hypothetical protein
MRKTKILALILAILMLMGSATLFSSCKKDGGSIVKVSKKTVELTLGDYALLYGDSQSGSDYTATFRDYGLGKTVGVTTYGKGSMQSIIPLVYYGYSGALKLNGVHEWQAIGNLLKHTTDKLKIKPYTRKPSGKVGKQRTAYSANLLIVKYTSEKQAERNVKKAYRYNKEHGIEDVDHYIKPKHYCRYIAYDALRYTYRNYRQRVAENKIGRAKRRGVKAL